MCLFLQTGERACFFRVTRDRPEVDLATGSDRNTVGVLDAGGASVQARGGRHRCCTAVAPPPLCPQLCGRVREHAAALARQPAFWPLGPVSLSPQVVFIPEHDILQDYYPVSHITGTIFRLYSHSYNGFGYNQARDSPHCSDGCLGASAYAHVLPVDCVCPSSAFALVHSARRALRASLIAL